MGWRRQAWSLSPRHMCLPPTSGSGPGCPLRQTVVTAWRVGAAHLATRGCEFFCCCNKLTRSTKKNTCSTLISVDFGAACSLSCYIVETSAKHRRCQLERLWQADRVSDFRKQASIRNKDLTSEVKASQHSEQISQVEAGTPRRGESLDLTFCILKGSASDSMSHAPAYQIGLIKSAACQNNQHIKPQQQSNRSGTSNHAHHPQHIKTFSVSNRSKSILPAYHQKISRNRPAHQNAKHRPACL